MTPTSSKFKQRSLTHVFAQSMIVVSIYAAQRNAVAWSNPDVFQPLRHVLEADATEEAATSTTGDDNLFCPFSLGPRTFVKDII